VVVSEKSAGKDWVLLLYALKRVEIDQDLLGRRGMVTEAQIHWMEQYLAY
jgi:hypothetical protein